MNDWFDMPLHYGPDIAVRESGQETSDTHTEDDSMSTIVPECNAECCHGG